MRSQHGEKLSGSLHRCLFQCLDLVNKWLFASRAVRVKGSRVLLLLLHRAYTEASAHKSLQTCTTFHQETSSDMRCEKPLFTTMHIWLPKQPDCRAIVRTLLSSDVASMQLLSKVSGPSALAQEARATDRSGFRSCGCFQTMSGNWEASRAISGHLVALLPSEFAMLNTLCMPSVCLGYLLLHVSLWRTLLDRSVGAKTPKTLTFDPSALMHRSMP